MSEIPNESQPIRSFEAYECIETPVPDLFKDAFSLRAKLGKASSLLIDVTIEARDIMIKASPYLISLAVIGVCGKVGAEFAHSYSQNLTGIGFIAGAYAGIGLVHSTGRAISTWIDIVKDIN